MRRSDFSPGIGRSSLPSRVLPQSGPGEISWGKVEKCPAAPALSTRPPRSDIGRRVAEHTCPGQTSLLEGSLSFGAAVCLQLPSHTPSRERRCLSITVNLYLVQLPSTRGCLRQAPQGTCTPNRSTMPSAIRLAALAFTPLAPKEYTRYPFVSVRSNVDYCTTCN